MQKNKPYLLVAVLFNAAFIHCAHDHNSSRNSASDAAPQSVQHAHSASVAAMQVDDTNQQAAQAPPEATPRRAPMSLDELDEVDRVTGRRKAQTATPEGSTEPDRKRPRLDAAILKKRITEDIRDKWVELQHKENDFKRHHNEAYGFAACTADNCYLERRQLIIDAINNHTIDPNDICLYKDDIRPHIYDSVLNDAIGHNDLDFTTFLLEHGANPQVDLDTLTNKDIIKLLIPYIKKNEPKVVDRFIEEAFFEAVTESKYSADLIEFYLALGADITWRQYGATALHNLILFHEKTNDAQKLMLAKAAILVEAGVPLDAEIIGDRYPGHTWQTLIQLKIKEVKNARLKEAYIRLEKVILKAIEAKAQRAAVAIEHLKGFQVLPAALIPVVIAYLRQSK